MSRKQYSYLKLKFIQSLIMKHLSFYFLFFYIFFSIYLFHFFFIQFCVPLKIISAHETSQSVGGAKMGEPQEIPPGRAASRTWLVSHGPHVGLKPTPDKAVR